MTTRIIIHPTDLLASSKAALKFASFQAPLLNAKLLIVHIAPPTASYLGASTVAAGFPVAGTVPDPATTSALPERNQALRDDLLAVTPTDDKVVFEHLLLEGDPATEIVDLARKLDATQIVMGSHGRQGITRVLVGSVAESVLRDAPCPVTVVKPQQQTSQRG